MISIEFRKILTYQVSWKSIQWETELFHADGQTWQILIIIFYVHGSVHRESLSLTVQHDATIYSFITFSADSSTCFALYPHPSSGAHSNCNYIWHWSNRVCYRPLTWRSRTPPRQRTVANTVRIVPDVITVWVCSCWWMGVSSETCSALFRKRNKLLDNYWL